MSIPADLNLLHGVPFDSARARWIGEGFAAQVYRCGDWLLKVARNPAAYESLRTEQAVLASLPPLPVATPTDYVLLPPGEALPHGGAYFQPVAGDPCDAPVRLQPGDIAALLLALHDSPAHPGQPVPLVTWHWRDLDGSVSPALLDACQQVFSDYQAPAVRCFIHGDFWPGNWIIHEGRLTGLIDWGDAGHGDIAIDFAGFAYLPSAFAAAVLDCYVAAGGEPGADFSERMKVARLRRELDGLAYALAHPALGEVADCLAKLHALARRYGLPGRD